MRSAWSGDTTASAWGFGQPIVCDLHFRHGCQQGCAQGCTDGKLAVAVAVVVIVWVPGPGSRPSKERGEAPTKEAAQHGRRASSLQQVGLAIRPLHHFGLTARSRLTRRA